MIIGVDIDKVKEFVYSDEFREFLLLDSTADVATASFILCTLKQKINKLEQTEEGAK